jgi:hypothetical protein
VFDPAIDGVGAFQPAQDLCRHRVVHRRVALVQSLAVVAQLVEATVLQGMQVLLQHGR